MGHGMVAGVVKVVCSCWLPPLLMLELPILLVSISLSFIPLSWQPSVEFLIHQKATIEGKGEENCKFHHKALNKGHRCFVKQILR